MGCIVPIRKETSVQEKPDHTHKIVWSLVWLSAVLTGFGYFKLICIVCGYILRHFPH